MTSQTTFLSYLVVIIGLIIFAFAYFRGRGRKEHYDIYETERQIKNNSKLEGKQ